MVEFIGTETFPQGYGMTWDSVVVDVADDERIIDAQARSRGSGPMDHEVPVVRVWLMSPEKIQT